MIRKIVLVFYAIFAISLTQLPLTKYFSYEFSIIISIFSTLVVSFLFLDTLCNYELSNYNKSFKDSKLYLFFFLFPFFVGFINSLIIGNCQFADGIPYYFLFALPSFFIGRGLGLIAFLISRKSSYIILILLIIAILLIPILEIYFFPQIYFYNPIISFFPGTIYDEDITITFPLILYKLLNIIYFEGIVIVFFILESKKSLLLLLTFSIAILFWLFAPHINLATPNYVLEKKLNHKIRSENFVIFSQDKLDSVKIRKISELHERYYSELQEFYQVKPSKIIKSYIFSTNEEKQSLFGAGNADVAKPWLYQIYITNSSLNSTLKHEISHIFTAEFGVGVLKVADDINFAMIEGLAMASDNVFDYNYIDRIVANGYKFGLTINLEELFSGLNFFKTSSTASYLLSGAFIEYLYKKYGIEKIKKLYGNLDFQLNYGKSLKQLETEFKDYIDKLEYTESELLAQFYFNRKGLFQKDCPRFLAKKLKKGLKLIINGELSESLNLLSELEKENTLPDISLYKSLIFERKSEYKQNLAYCIERLNIFRNSAIVGILKLKIADMYSLVGEQDKANLYYDSIMIGYPEHRFYYSAYAKKILSNANLLKSFYEANSEIKYQIILNLFNKNQDILLLPLLINHSNDKNIYEFLNQSILQSVSESNSIFLNLKLKEALG